MKRDLRREYQSHNMRNVPEGGMKTKKEKSERVKNKIGTVLGAWKTKVGREECEGTK